MIEVGIEPGSVEQSRHRDHVGDADLRLPPVAVEAETVGAYCLDLERLTIPAVFGVSVGGLRPDRATIAAIWLSYFNR